MFKLKSGLTIVALLLLSACSSNRYSLSDDVAPNAPLTVDHIEDAVPRYEPYSQGGNRTYTVRGKTYQVLRDPQEFTQQGIASWYGKKFHGHRTSNGEVYDMYSMSAAHKTLPLPSYVKVTNTDNQKSVIVRVNDRGPFHEGRVIDLSYAAAYKLDVVNTGTAPVKVELIKVERTDDLTNTKSPYYAVQVASSKNLDVATQWLAELEKSTGTQGYTEKSGRYHRIILGPIYDFKTSEKVLAKVKELGHSSAFLRTKTPKVSN
jgi:rare lipoprotein A